MIAMEIKIKNAESMKDELIHLQEISRHNTNSGAVKFAIINYVFIHDRLYESNRENLDLKEEIRRLKADKEQFVRSMRLFLDV